MLHARDDADDRAPGPGVAEAQLLADGVAVRPEPARQGLVHDDDERGVRPIAGLEQAATAEPRADGLEVARRHRADARHQLRLVRSGLAALDDEDLLGLAVAERRRRREADAPHARQRGHARRRAASRTPAHAPDHRPAAGPATGSTPVRRARPPAGTRDRRPAARRGCAAAAPPRPAAPPTGRTAPRRRRPPAGGRPRCASPASRRARRRADRRARRARRARHRRAPRSGPSRPP